ncbi:MAG TPA: hypothetical protein VGA78_15430 [Gemmatimonadales bacterium]
MVPGFRASVPNAIAVNPLREAGSMKQTLLFAGLGLVLVAGCSDSSRTGSDLPSAPGVIVLGPPQQPEGCVFKNAQDYAKNYFKLSSDRRATASALSDAQKLTAGDPLRDDFLFDVLGAVARVGGTDDAGDAGIGALLVNEVVDCGGEDWIVTDKRAFIPVLTSALTEGNLTLGIGGEFAIRGLGTPETEGAVVAGSGLFAFDINVGQGSWADVGRVAVFLGDVSGENGSFGVGKVQNVVYRQGFISDGDPEPNFTTDDQFAAEFCLDGLNTTDLGNRLGRNRGVGNNTVLQQDGADVVGFCGDLAAAGGSSHSRSKPTVFARLLNSMVGLFKPTPLQALMFVPPWSGSSGGEEEGIFSSDYAVVNVEAVFDSILQPIVNQVKDSTFDVTVTVCALNTCGNPIGVAGVPLENAEVIITVIGNFGSPIVLSGTGCGTPDNLSCTGHTDENGVVTFTVSLNKTGSYTFSAVTKFDPFEVQTSSNQFIVNPN